jgi:hypothetical protein
MADRIFENITANQVSVKYRVDDEWRRQEFIASGHQPQRDQSVTFKLTDLTPETRSALLDLAHNPALNTTRTVRVPWGMTVQLGAFLANDQYDPEDSIGDAWTFEPAIFAGQIDQHTCEEAIQETAQSWVSIWGWLKEARQRHDAALHLASGQKLTNAVLNGSELNANERMEVAAILMRHFGIGAEE